MAEHVQGTVQIANDVLADLAGFTALECYGIVGMASPTIRDGVAQALSREKLRKGVRITNEEDGVRVDLYVIIEHGTNIAEVSHNLANRVQYVLTTMGDVKVSTVEVHVQDVKVRQ